MFMYFDLLFSINAAMLSAEKTFMYIFLQLCKGCHNYMKKNKKRG